MAQPFTSRLIRRCRHLGLVLLVVVPPSLAADAPETIGRIEGSFTASGRVSITQDNGSSVTTLLSGSEIVVANGHARMTLLDGSELDVCGPANFSLLKSGGAITLALNHGRVHGRISANLPLAIYTAMIVATPVSISREPRDFVIALDARGTLGIRAEHGAVRLEHQFSGQSVLVPRYAEMQLKNGELETLAAAAPGSCRCEIPVVAKAQPAPAPVAAPQVATKQTDVSVAAPNPPKPDASRAEPSAAEIPTFTAVMPPLTFDALSPSPPASTRPEMVLLIREVRVQPATVFTGRVEPRSTRSQSRVAFAERAASTEAATGEKKPSFGTRFANFFRRLFGGKPKT